MTISLTKAFETVVSERYNKFNIFVFIVLITILNALYFYTQSNNNVKFCILAYIILFLIEGGYASVVNNLEIKGSKSAFPSLLNFGDILSAGIKFLFGSLISVLILLFIPITALAVLMPICFDMFNQILPSIIITIVLSLITVIFSLFIMFKVFIPLILMFYENLEFKSFFLFTKTKAYLEERRGKYLLYIGKSILLSLIALIIPAVLIFVLFIISLPLNINVPVNTSTIIMNTIFAVITSLFMTTVEPCLNAQFVNIPKTEPIQTYNW